MREGLATLGPLDRFAIDSEHMRQHAGWDGPDQREHHGFPLVVHRAIVGEYVSEVMDQSGFDVIEFVRLLADVDEMCCPDGSATQDADRLSPAWSAIGTERLRLRMNAVLGDDLRDRLQPDRVARRLTSRDRVGATCRSGTAMPGLPQLQRIALRRLHRLP